ncbi:MAG: protease pro-enzyme activation domain-containing protein [Janthinobacterium lividum]
MFLSCKLRFLLSVVLCSLLGSYSASVSAQVTAVRIATPISNAERTTIAGSHLPQARAAEDVGDMDASTALVGMSLVFSRTASQEAELQELLAAHQSRSSPLYHAWLTPEQFAARFGMSDTDLATAKAWLEGQGFTNVGVNRSRNRLRFSGRAAQAESAFGVALHNFRSGTTMHFAPANDISLPAPIAALTSQVTGLSSFRPHPHLRVRGKVQAPTANFTSSQSGSHYLTPGDIKTIYDITPAYTAGYTGTGQTIAVVGQSAVVLSDIEKFQSAAGLTTKDPTLVLVPNSGNSTVYPDDESESDLDLEYSGSIATGATIKFVYVGNNLNSSVTDSIAYAVDNNLAPILSTSYGDCEADLGSADYATQNAVFEQASAQGQTIVSAAGDDGSSDCAEDNSSGLAVDFPASSQYVTGMGGTEFPSADVASTNTTYWTAATGTDVISSALSYIPEEAWNESTTSELSSGGGGASILTARPSWQTGVTGIPTGSYRLVPDISLVSAIDSPGYLYCSSDTAADVTGSCSNGFRDSSDTYLTVAGGTSFAAPIFSGMLALINQAQGATTGQGLVNSTLYSLATNSTTYASTFHDVTSGNNECPSGYEYCATAAQAAYFASTGYDEATGLGSIDLYKLLTAWSSTGTTTSNLVSSSTTLTAATTTPASGASDAITITVASGSSSSTTTPTGSVTITVDGATSTTSLALSSGAASYTFASTASGTHTVTATYSGDATYAASTGTITLTVPSTAVASSSFTVAATSVSVTAGSSGSSTVTVTPAGGYTGTVDWAVTSSATLTNACYGISNTKVSGTSAVTTTLTVYTSASACSSETPLSQPTSRHAFTKTGQRDSASGAQKPDLHPGRHESEELILAACCLFGIPYTRVRRPRRLAVLIALVATGLGISGCGGSSTAATTDTNAAAGTYTLTLTGTDSASSTLTASTTFTLTVH